MGRGEYQRDAKLTVETALALDIRALAHAGNLGNSLSVFATTWTHGLSESSVGVTVLNGRRALVSYRDARGEVTTEHIVFQWTTCNFGGTRPWWTCPQCDRRCAIVYARGAWPFMCRLCANLTYETAQSDASTRAICKSNRRRARLGWELTEPFPPKPKGMHWRTFERLFAESAVAASIESAAFDAWLDCMEREIEHITRVGGPD
jgi:hypothetical protein